MHCLLLTILKFVAPFRKHEFISFVSSANQTKAHAHTLTLRNVLYSQICVHAPERCRIPCSQFYKNKKEVEIQHKQISLTILSVSLTRGISSHVRHDWLASLVWVQSHWIENMFVFITYLQRFACQCANIACDA